jgi:hypothetical protein
VNDKDDIPAICKWIFDLLEWSTESGHVALKPKAPHVGGVRARLCGAWWPITEIPRFGRLKLAGLTMTRSIWFPLILSGISNDSNGWDMDVWVNLGICWPIPSYNISSPHSMAIKNLPPSSSRVYYRKWLLSVIATNSRTTSKPILYGPPTYRLVYHYSMHGTHGWNPS